MYHIYFILLFHIRLILLYHIIYTYVYYIHSEALLTRVNIHSFILLDECLCILYVYSIVTDQDFIFKRLQLDVYL